MIAIERDREEGPFWQRHRAAIVAAFLLAAVAYGIISVLNGGGSEHKRVVETIALKVIPPPPPPKVEPPPEPPKMVEEQKIQPPVDKPLDTPKDAPPPGPLSLEGKGGPGNDAFGLGGKIGGSDFLDGAGGGTRFGHFAVLMQDRITKSLHDDEKLNADKFVATIKVWLTGSGKIERVEFLRTTGEAEIDNRIQQVITAMPELPEAPPKDMPQPVIIRIGARPGFG